MRRSLLLCALLCAVGCGGKHVASDGLLFFGGTDAGHGARGDSGPAQNTDSGVVSEDARASQDAGLTQDAGEPFDAGNPIDTDAGPVDTDAGTVDAGPMQVCDSKTQYIYTLAQDNTLSQFYPPNLSFNTVGRVNCRGVLGSPFSMAVDRYANIWSVFTDGKIYRINPANAGCVSTTFAAFQHGFTTFGMGFSSNTPGSWDETLYVSNSDGSGLGKIDTTTMRLTTIGSGYSGLSGGTTGRAELTGTGDAKLYGAFEGSPFQVDEINKANANILSSAAQTGVTTGSSGSNFAFASWSGDFFLFVGDGSSTNVYQYVPGVGTTMVAHTSLVIVGAGVSTCAPSSAQ
jgi:hypothetical protein